MPARAWVSASLAGALPAVLPATPLYSPLLCPPGFSVADQQPPADKLAMQSRLNVVHLMPSVVCVSASVLVLCPLSVPPSPSRVLCCVPLSQPAPRWRFAAAGKQTGHAKHDQRLYMSCLVSSVLMQVFLVLCTLSFPRSPCRVLCCVPLSEYGSSAAASGQTYRTVYLQAVQVMPAVAWIGASAADALHAVLPDIHLYGPLLRPTLQCGSSAAAVVIHASLRLSVKCLGIELN